LDIYWLCIVKVMREKSVFLSASYFEKYQVENFKALKRKILSALSYLKIKT
jgi:hypothetical protein